MTACFFANNIADVLVAARQEAGAFRRRDAPTAGLDRHYSKARRCESSDRLSAVVTLRVEDYCQQGRRSWLRLHKKAARAKV
jgi:hypothetical protein